LFTRATELRTDKHFYPHHVPLYRRNKKLGRDSATREPLPDCAPCEKFSTHLPYTPLVFPVGITITM